jgi:hypothetical protein
MKKVDSSKKDDKKKPVVKNGTKKPNPFAKKK